MKTLKKFFAVSVAAAVILLAFSGCTGNREANIDKYEVDSANVITTELGITPKLPSDASDAKYYVIDTVAQINYTADGESYVFRAQKVDGVDVSGIEAGDKQLKDTFDLVENSESATISFYEVKSGGLLAGWSIGGTSYSLFNSSASATDELSYATFADVADTLAGENAPA